ncbi:MAG: alpha/beta hydrolase, partial [Acinetobacter sp.]|nr:alpha/beta hydrolase [Acinetobacter sp.]
EDMNYFGVLLQVQEAGRAQLAAQHPRDLALHLADEEGGFKIECLIFENSAHQLRALFKHGSFDVAERLLRFVQRQKEQTLLLEAV